jgi:hypothetical protein
MPSQHIDGWYQQQARIQFEKDGELEFDDIPKVSKNDAGEDGAYVQCWVWVDDE